MKVYTYKCIHHLATESSAQKVDLTEIVNKILLKYTLSAHNSFKMRQNALKLILLLLKYHELFSRNLLAFLQKLSKIDSLHVTVMVHWSAHQTTKNITPTIENI